MKLATELDLSLDEVIIYSGHIVTYGLGKIINVINGKSRFGLNHKTKEFSLALNEILYKKFQKKFSYDLNLILSIFSNPNPILKQKEKLSIEDKVFLDLLVWLIKQSLLIEYKTYIYMKVEEQELKNVITKLKASKSENNSKTGDILNELIYFSMKKKDINEISYELGLEPLFLHNFIKKNKIFFSTYITE